MENKKDYTKWKKISIIVIMTILLVGMLAGAFAYTPQTTFIDKFPIQVMPKVNGYMKPNTQFDYTFIFAEDENCVDDLYTKSVSITTDAYGVGSTTLDLSTMDGIPSYLCEYRDSNLRAVHPLNERMFISQITEQDIEDYGFIKIDTNTQLNESQVDSYVSNNGYLKNETDPTFTLQKLQNLTFNDYHNIGGIDRVLNQSEIEDMGFSIIDNDYCSNGICGGDLTINGDLTLIGSITNVNATNVKSNGSIVPDYNSVFDLGTNLNKWNNVFANTLYGNIDYSQIQNVPLFLLTETDPQVTSTINGQWCRGTGSAIACDVTPVVDTKLTDSDIFTMGYIKSWTETDPIYASSSASTITSTDIFNWNNAFSWGNHQNAGYITDPDDAVDSNELDNLCNQNGMILKRINNTWGCSSDIGFIPTSLLIDYNFTDNSIDWNKVYYDYYNNTNGYLTSFTETDPIFIGSPSYNINNSDISNWNLVYSWGNHNTQGYLKNETDPLYSTSPSSYITNSNISDWSEAYSWGNHGTFGYLTSETDPTFSSSASSNISTYDISNWNTAFSWGDHSIQGYLKNETDPLYVADKNGIVFYIDTINWDKNVSDDFNGQWSSLNAIPIGFLDGVDNDTTYTNISEFTNDVGYLTSFSETDPIFISSPVYHINNSDILNWNNVYYDYYNNTNSYLTIETDPVYIAEKSGIVFFIDTALWDTNVSDDFNGDYNNLTNKPTSLSQFVNDVGYLTGFNETDPQFNNDKPYLVYINSTSNWDKDSSDDFDYQWSSLLNVPVGFVDGVDNDTKYYNLSEFVNDVGYLTSFSETDPIWNSEKNGYVLINSTDLWDKDYTDDFNGSWYALTYVPNGFSDGVDNDTKYYALSEFTNDVGYLTGFNETDPLFVSSPSNGITYIMIDNWEQVFNDYYNNTNGYLTSFTETDPIWNNEKNNYVSINSTSNWDKDVSDDFDYQWSSLLNIPYYITDGDNDTKYYNLSEFFNDVGFITSYIDTQLNETQVDDYVSNNGYLTSFTESDPIWNSDKLNYLLISSTLNWDTNVSDDFDGNYNNLFNTPTNLSSFFNDVGYLSSFAELDPLFISSVSYGINQSMIDNWNYVFNQINSGGNSSVIFEDDTLLWDKDYTDDFSGSWNNLTNVPIGFLDGIDDDTTYSDLSEFNNDVGYYKSGDSPNFNDIETNSISVGGQSVCLEDGTNCQEIVNNTQLYNPKYVNIKDEFLGDSTENGELGELGWTIDHYNGATTFYEEYDLTDIATHPAVVTCSDDDDGLKAGCTYSLGESFVLNGGETFGYVVQSTQLSGSIKKFGMTDSLSNPVSDIDDGVYMVMSDLSSTIIGYVERNDNIQSCDTGVTINDYSWYQLEMKVNENANGVDFYVNDIYRCSVNTQLPTNSIGPKALGHYTGSGTNTDIFKIDLFYMTYELPNNRWD